MPDQPRGLHRTGLERLLIAILLTPARYGYTNNYQPAVLRGSFVFFIITHGIRSSIHVNRSKVDYERYVMNAHNMEMGPR